MNADTTPDPTTKTVTVTIEVELMVGADYDVDADMNAIRETVYSYLEHAIGEDSLEFTVK